MPFRRKKTAATPSPTPPRPAPHQARGGGAPAGGESIIAEGMVLHGNCQAEGPLRVEGHVTGSVDAARLAIGTTGRVDGDVTSEGAGADQTVVIDGRVGGAVRAPRVEIGPDGAVGAGMVAREAVVRGRVAGTIETDGRLVLEETAIVEGDVTARRLGLREGGQVFGTIRIGEPPKRPLGGGEPRGDRPEDGAPGDNG